jgi:hypothetical protein
MKPNQINGIKQFAAKLAQDTITKQQHDLRLMAISTISAAMCITLHDKWNFTKDQLNVLLLQISEQFDCVLKDYVTMEDIEQWCKDYGIINMIELKED